MKYLKTAFLNHWNLLAFFAGTAFALLSVPDVVLPLVAAGEIAYVVLLGRIRSSRNTSTPRKPRPSAKRVPRPSSRRSTIS